jgi:putative nucleotidyltransferase with HDIG domain
MLEPFDLPELDNLQYSPCDLFDKHGRMLLAKGQAITPLIRELLDSREVFVLVAAEQDWECKLFPQMTYHDTITRLERLYRNIEIVHHEHLKEVIQIVDDLLKVVDSNMRVFVDLNLLRTHDNYTFVHSTNVSILASLIGKEMGLGALALRQLALGALLHDLGKVKIPGVIINKPSMLTYEEFAIVKLHPRFGTEMLKETLLPWEVLAVVSQHHERWNGSGYPDGLKQEEISLNAQITSVADVFDAVVSNRPYRPGFPIYQAVELIINRQGIDFSPEVVKAFSSAIVVYPLNAIVTLNTGEVGIVTSIHPRWPTRPQVRLLLGKDGQPVEAPVTIDLMKHLTCFIVAVEYGK